MGKEVRAGINDVWPVAISLVPLGVAFGLLITQVGFSWWWAPIFSIAIYAGSMEFLAISLVTGGVGPLSAALYALLVNFRHLFYALNYPIDRVKSTLGRAYGVYALTDEAYAILSTRPGTRWTEPRVLAIQASLQSCWVFGGIIGGIFGAALPFEIKGMEFALLALFVVLAIEAFKAYRDISLPVTAIVCGLLGLWISATNVLMIGMVFYFAILLLRHYVPTVNKALTWGESRA